MAMDVNEWFYCAWYKKWTNLRLCRDCYDNLIGECDPEDELMYYKSLRKLEREQL
jgi:DICT domain-containing protein